MIKNIVFDMGGVLLDWNPSLFLSNFEIAEEDRQLIVDTVFRDFRWALLDNGYYASEEDFLKEVCPLLPERLRGIARETVLNWEQFGIPEIEGMYSLVDKLHSKGYKIYLLSNAGPRQPEYWKKMRVSRFFDGTVISALEKQFKPGVEIFKTLLKRFNLNADECIFIDDLSANCAGAFLAGLHPIRFISCDLTLKKLRELGVSI